MTTGGAIAVALLAALVALVLFKIRGHCPHGGRPPGYDNGNPTIMDGDGGD
jgi:hypothetical protein